MSAAIAHLHVSRMDPFLHVIWRRCKGTRRGRFLAGMIVGALFGLPASLSVSHDPTTVGTWSCVAALIGGFAALLLESRDQRRSVTPHWQQRVERTAAQIREDYPDVPPPLAREVAAAHEQQRFTPLVWIGIAVGILCALCGVLAFILKVVALFRT